jgi:hypothetical protein
MVDHLVIGPNFRRLEHCPHADVKLLISVRRSAQDPRLLHDRVLHVSRLTRSRLCTKREDSLSTTNGHGTELLLFSEDISSS